MNKKIQFVPLFLMDSAHLGLFFLIFIFLCSLNMYNMLYKI